jgi:Helix-turn-helix domain
MTNEHLLTPTEVAARWRISVKTLANWRTQKKGPHYIKLGGNRNQRVFYTMDAVLGYERKSLRGEENG